ncbi:hypothetical protein EVAR_72505_1, partial [Eumeta japonica]
ANRWYVAWACINGPSSDCGSSGQPMVINDEIGFHFKTSKKSNNGTDVNAGQIPCLLYNLVSHTHTIPARNADIGESIIMLSKNMSRKVTVPCFRSLIKLLQWSWNTFKATVLDTNGQIPITYQKLTIMKHQKRLVYVIRACLRLIKSYINEVYPQNKKRRNSIEYMSYFEAVADVRNLIQGIMADPTPTCAMLPQRVGKNKAHREGVVPPSKIRELISTCAAMCASRSLRDVLQYVVPLTQISLLSTENRRPDSKILKSEVPTKSATVPRASHAQRPPPVPPRANNRDSQPKASSVIKIIMYEEKHN